MTQRYIRSVIHALWLQTKDGANTFRETLEAGIVGYWNKTSSGWQVQSSSGAGYSTSFHIPTNSDDPNSTTPENLQALFKHIFENYELLVASGTPESNEDSFRQALEAYFPTIKGRTNNWQYLTP